MTSLYCFWEYRTWYDNNADIECVKVIITMILRMQLIILTLTNSDYNKSAISLPFCSRCFMLPCFNCLCLFMLLLRSVLQLHKSQTYIFPTCFASWCYCKLSLLFVLNSHSLHLYFDSLPSCTYNMCWLRFHFLVNGFSHLSQFSLTFICTVFMCLSRLSFFVNLALHTLHMLSLWFFDLIFSIMLCLKQCFIIFG